MSNRADWGATSKASVTVLVDNWADLIVGSTDTVRRFTDAPLLAEHGFSALVDLGDGETRILWDAGASRIALVENVRRMEIDLSTVHVIALSHGHHDHVGAMTDAIKSIVHRPEPRRWEAGASIEAIAKWAEMARVPIVAHPAAFRERWALGQDGVRHGPVLPPPCDEWEAVGAEVVLSEGPHKLAPGCWTTGMVPRHSFERAGRSKRRQYRVGTTFQPDDLADDQAIAINVRGKGLIVLAGCAHSGIVNTLDYVREISGEDRVIGVLGGFHLGTASEDEIERTIDEVQRIGPNLVSPSHCTGFRAIRRFAERMPDQFVLGVVGTTFLF